MAEISRWTIIMLCMKLMVVNTEEELNYHDEYILLRSYGCGENTFLRYDSYTNVTEGVNGVDYNLIMDVEDPITNEYKLQINAAMWNNGDWEENFLTLQKGPACDVLKLYDCLPCNLWAHVRSEMEPPIKEMCLIEPGHYELYKFIAKRSDLPKIPFLFPGTFKTTVRLYDEYDYLMYCEIFEVEVDRHYLKY